MNMNPLERKTLQTIHIVMISHKYGQNIAACASVERAEQYLYDYVTEWWDDALDEQVGKLDSLSRSEAIAGYFDAHAEALDPEGFAIEKLPVLL